jgi:hypothetical protein
MSGPNEKIAPSAPGASLLCPASLIPASHADAPQTLAIEGEPHATPPTCSGGAGGAPMTRRLLMNSIVALPIAAAVPTAAPAMSPPSTPDTDRRALEAYASWLFMERRILCGELWPHMGAEAEKYNWFDNAGAGWHSRGDGDWQDLPQPSTRAAAVLDLVGVDWQQPKRDLGLDHEDTGHRPVLPPGWPAIHPDARLLELQEKIFEAHEAATVHHTEIRRLNDIVSAEHGRLYDDVFVHRRSNLTEEERWAIIYPMPEAKEHDRLVTLAEPHNDRVLELIERMWTIPATTPEGRQAKFVVLLDHVTGVDWLKPDGPADWHIEMARKLMIEFIGGEPAKQLRDQFARR